MTKTGESELIEILSCLATNQEIRGYKADAETIEQAKQRIQELEAELADLQQTFDLQWNAQMRGIEAWQKETGQTLTCPDTKKFTMWLLSQLSGVHAGTHCIVPYEFIELAADPVGADECRELEHYIDTIETWADRVRRKAEPFLSAMLIESKETE